LILQQAYLPADSIILVFKRTDGRFRVGRIEDSVPNTQHLHS
jgi:hypothetical protein